MSRILSNEPAGILDRTQTATAAVSDPDSGFNLVTGPSVAIHSTIADRSLTVIATVTPWSNVFGFIRMVFPGRMFEGFSVGDLRLPSGVSGEPDGHQSIDSVSIPSVVGYRLVAH